MTSASTRLTGTRKLDVVKTLANHEPYSKYPSGLKQREVMGGPAISYFTDGQKMFSGYDKSARVWNLKAGEEMEERVVFQGVHFVAVSRDSRWIVVAGGKGVLKVCGVNTGRHRSQKNIQGMRI